MLRAIYIQISCLLLLNSALFAQDTTIQPFKLGDELSRIRETLQEWDESVLGFRREHNFLVQFGASRNTWRLRRYGNLLNQESRQASVDMRASYTYHIEWFYGLGYYLGSGIGAEIQTSDNQQVDYLSIIKFPGILAGTVWNANPGLRLLFGLEYYLERWSDFRDQRQPDVEPVSISSRAFDLTAAADFFFNLRWAIRTEFRYHRSKLQIPKSAGGTPIDVDIEKHAYSGALGLVYHLL